MKEILCKMYEWAMLTLIGLVVLVLAWVVITGFAEAIVHPVY